MEIQHDPVKGSRRRFAIGMIGAVVAAGGVQHAAAMQQSTPTAGMTVADTQQLLGSYSQALSTGGDFGQFLAEEARLTYMDTGETVAGRQNVVDAIIDLHTVRFAAQPEVVNIVIGAGTAGVEAVFNATHTGEFAGIPVTGASVSVPYAGFFSMADGVITELRLYGLTTGLIAQLSAAGTPAATPGG